MIANSRGSVLLFMVISISMLTLLITTFLSNTGKAIDLLLYKQQQVKQSYLAESLLDYAIAFLIENYELITLQLKDNASPITIVVGNWPPLSSVISTYTATFSITLNKNSSVKIEAVLYNKESMAKATCYACSLQYKIDFEEKSNVFFVEEWHRRVLH